MVGPRDVAITNRHLLLWLGVVLKNGVRHFERQVGNNSAIDRNGIELFLQARGRYAVKTDRAVDFLSV
ncbi:hypothetical protein D9M70_610920 [compost metagenome]